jgi:hypothetical protein
MIIVYIFEVITLYKILFLHSINYFLKQLRFSFFFFSYVFVNNLYSQSITPYTLSNGGGSSVNMEWSIGESVSIANFIASGYSLNTGVLQPMTSIVTAINEYGPAVFATQITIGPNPTSNLLHIKARFNQVGNLSLQLIDAKSAIIFTQEAGTIFSSYDKDILMENYPSGVFYMKVYFKPITGIAKTGIYKIIKL